MITWRWSTWIAAIWFTGTDRAVGGPPTEPAAVPGETALRENRGVVAVPTWSEAPSH